MKSVGLVTTHRPGERQDLPLAQHGRQLTRAAWQLGRLGRPGHGHGAGVRNPHLLSTGPREKNRSGRAVAPARAPSALVHALEGLADHGVLEGTGYRRVCLLREQLRQYHVHRVCGV